MFFKRIKKLWSKKPFVSGDRVQCPHCNCVFILVKIETSVRPNQLLSTVTYIEGG